MIFKELLSLCLYEYLGGYFSDLNASLDLLSSQGEDNGYLNRSLVKFGCIQSFNSLSWLFIMIGAFTHFNFRPLTPSSPLKILGEGIPFFFSIFSHAGPYSSYFYFSYADLENHIFIKRLWLWSILNQYERYCLFFYHLRVVCNTVWKL